MPQRKGAPLTPIVFDATKSGHGDTRDPIPKIIYEGTELKVSVNRLVDFTGKGEMLIQSLSDI